MPVSFNPNATFRRNGKPNVNVPTKLHNGKENPHKAAVIARQNELAALEEGNLKAKKAAAAGVVVLNMPKGPNLPKFVPFNLTKFTLMKNQEKLANSNGATAPKLSKNNNSPAGGKRTRRKMRKSKKTRRH
jgi:hypothetical protein